MATTTSIDLDLPQDRRNTVETTRYNLDSQPYPTILALMKVGFSVDLSERLYGFRHFHTVLGLSPRPLGDNFDLAPLT